MAKLGATVVLGCRNVDAARQISQEIRCRPGCYMNFCPRTFHVHHLRLQHSVQIRSIKSVFLSCPAFRKEVPGADIIIPCPLDLAKPASIHSFVNTYRQQGYPLHLLINNAGAAYRREWYTDEGVAGLTQVLHLESCTHLSSMLAFSMLNRPNGCLCTAHHIQII